MDNLPSGYREPPSFDEYIEAKDECINSLSQKNDKLESQKKALRELVYKCRSMQYARTTAECSGIWNEVEEKLREIDNA